ncbi:hypothetical protein BMBphi_gp022 [Bacillus phage vB_BthS_BMBphi]|nr:hypothetical protein BMBphi_gp022 [Bacillus phage vB_BthS_BMBphi]
MKRSEVKENMIVEITKGKHEGCTARVIENTGCITVVLESGLQMGLEVEIHEDWIKEGEHFTFHVGANRNGERIFFECKGLPESHIVADNARFQYSRVTINEKKPKGVIYTKETSPDMYIKGGN